MPVTVDLLDPFGYDTAAATDARIAHLAGIEHHLRLSGTRRKSGRDIRPGC